MNQHLWLIQQLNEQRQQELQKEAKQALLVQELRSNKQTNKNQSTVASLFKRTRA